MKNRNQTPGGSCACNGNHTDPGLRGGNDRMRQSCGCGNTNRQSCGCNHAGQQGTQCAGAPRRIQNSQPSSSCQRKEKKECTVEKTCCNTESACNTPLEIFTPANCQKMPQLRHVTGTGAPNCAVTVEISGYPKISTCTSCTGRFEVQVPYQLSQGFHKVRVCYDECEQGRCTGRGDTVWLYITSTCPAPACDCETDSFDLRLLCAQSGSAFRTIDVTLCAQGYTGPVTVNYLLVPPCASAPSREEIRCFNDMCALSCGTYARGSFTFIADTCGTTITYALTGLEQSAGMESVTGLVDGYCYDLYLYASADCSCSAILSTGPIMAMPFAGVVDPENCIFALEELTQEQIALYPDLQPNHPLNESGVAETARMLQNIQRLATLYDETNGMYGYRGSLCGNYVLTTGFDLAGYVNAYEGDGWLPIGNYDARTSCGCGGTQYVFSGTLTGLGESTAITNLRINPTGASWVQYRGLFGVCQDAVIENVSIKNAVITFTPTDGTDESAAAGALAGAFWGGFIRLSHAVDVNIAAKAGSNPARFVNIGGLIGEGFDLLLDQSYTTGQIVSTATNNGGLAGLIGDCSTVQNSYSTVIVSGDGSVEGQNFGGLVGTAGCEMTLLNSYYAGSILRGNLASGGIAGSIHDGSIITSALNLGHSVEAVTGTAHRILGLDAGTLTQNYALGTIVLTVGGIVQLPVSDPNGLDGGSITSADIEGTIVSLNWDTDNIWDVSTIATLNRPVLIHNPPVV